MIFGKTYHENFLASQEKLKAAMGLRKKYAWFPTRMKCGRVVWLQEYYAEYWAYTNASGWITDTPKVFQKARTKEEIVL